MRICERALNFLQIINVDGDVRLCCWLKDGGVIGNLSENSLYEIWHGEKAELIRDRLIQHDYSNCSIDACPYLAMNTLSEHEIEVDEVPEYPEKLYLAYEEACNYKCMSCGHHLVMAANRGKDLSEKYQMIEERIREILPHLRHISANGRGEVFASPHILKILSSWKPVRPVGEVSASIETNGSLFNEKNWSKIENLGQYYLKVSVTVMSFDEYTYQILSGTKFPVSNIVHNLHFVKSLREQGIVNELELATVVQERNFRFLPEFTRRCIEEFGADTVRLRPYGLWGVQPKEIEWFADVRNKYHPYNKEYLEIMEDPIFRHPKVRDWGGGLSSETGEYPAEIRARENEKNGLVTKILSYMILHKQELVEKLKEIMQNAKTDQLAVYGYGVVGQAFVETIKEEIGISNIYDKNYPVGKSDPSQAIAPDRDMISREIVIIVTPTALFEVISEELAREYGADENALFSLEDIIFQKS